MDYKEIIDRRRARHAQFYARNPKQNKERRAELKLYQKYKKLHPLKCGCYTTPTEECPFKILKHVYFCILMGFNIVDEFD